MNNNGIYVSLDIGTSNVKVIIGELSGDVLNVIGVGNVVSKGVRKGSIVDIDETVLSIQKAVEQAERMVGVEINRVIVGIASNHIQLLPCHGVVAVASENREISDDDVARVIDAAQVVSIPPEREIIDVIPQQFIVDGLDEINDPRGMIGVRLEMEGTIITGSNTVLHNTLRCVERAGLDIIDICLQPLAAGSVALSKDEKNIGVALIDLGGGSTTVSVFEEGTLQVTSMLQVGGDHITKDLSIGLRTTTEEAEKMKKTYGHAYFDHASDEETFDVSMIGSNQTQTFSQLDIAEIIEARLEELFIMVGKELTALGYPHLPGGLVLTGGVASMPGVLELVQDVTQHNVRVAIADYIGVREPQYTTGVGVIQFAHRNMKIQGKEVAASIATEESNRPATTKKKKAPAAEPKDKNQPGLSKKVKHWFNNFFE
ncbi:cell division protein FtsA [Aureibacillus halotolerans]|uniref:Cell division protein FtsA n=1 Tax=Aureibacillus halotolerans TaxID=1508390 RepID=A0A4R6U983_9BACI|nr:cell division protein FtsA [Aureibacillus halotolerans]TDQ42332.1 cell division protein FtsA [Aureibacillus halotolerans]